MRWVGHVALVRKKKSTYEHFFRKLGKNESSGKC